MTPQILMCPPVFYKVPPIEYESALENDFMKKGSEAFRQDPDGFKKIADQQWIALYKTLENLGATVCLMDPVMDMPNQVFTADPVLCFQRKDGVKIAMLSRYSNVTRTNEVDQAILFLEKHFPDYVMLHSHHYTEGTGDNLYDPYRNIFWSGYTQRAGPEHIALGRSSIHAHKGLSLMTGLPVISLEVKRPFFHLDTAFAPLPSGHILCYAGGMSPQAFATLKQTAFAPYGLDQAEHLIEITTEDAYNYACNIRVIGDVIIMAQCSDDLKTRLKKAGYDVINHNLSHFIHYGGAVHCLTNNLTEKYE